MKLADQIKKQLDTKRTEAGEAFKAFSDYKDEHGDKIANEDSLFQEAHRLKSVHGEAAEAAKYLEEKLFQALAMDEDATVSGLKDVGGDGERFAAFLADGPTRAGKAQTLYQLVEKAIDAVEDSESYKAYRENKSLQGSASVGTLMTIEDVMERKAFKTLVTGVIDGQPAFLVPDLQPGYVEAFTRLSNVMTSLITVGTTDSDLVDWIRMLQPTWNADTRPEAVDDDKAFGVAPSTAPESALDFERASTEVTEIKHFIPATKRALADVGQLRTIIDQELLYGLQKVVDEQIIDGDGTGDNLLGILQTPGIQSQSAGGDPDVEVIHKAFTKLILAGYENLSVVMNALDWQDIRLAKDETGNYYYGPPSIAGGTQIWGNQVTFSQRLDAGTAIAGDFKRAATMWLREGASIVATDSHSDWFLKGIIAILASTRLAFAVTRPAAICEVDLT